jgi:hypothetical protein
MPHSDTPISKRRRNSWQILGEFDLTVNLDADHTVGQQLATILSPLNLPADFLNQVLRSAADSMAHALQTNAEVTFQHIHLSIFAPTKLNSDGRNWGFFRIEKIDSKDQDKEHPHLEIEFYLYVEGQ